MAKEKLPHAKDWNARSIEDWNAQTYLAYLRSQHEERLGVEYFGKSIAMESKLIKNMYEQYGKEIVKAFIDACITQYKPSGGYRVCSFYFMYTYMREYVLPQLLQRVSNEYQTEASRDTASIQW